MRAIGSIGILRPFSATLAFVDAHGPIQCEHIQQQQADLPFPPHHHYNHPMNQSQALGEEAVASLACKVKSDVLHGAFHEVHFYVHF